MLITAAISLAVWVAGNMLFGPPGFSSEYLEQFKDEHEYYLSISKSEFYKKWEQRPHLNSPDHPDAPKDFAAKLEFIEKYTARHEFIEEQHRKHIYELYFEIFNALLVAAIVFFFAKNNEERRIMARQSVSERIFSESTLHMYS